MSASETWEAPPSTMTIASLLQAIARSRSDWARWAAVGLASSFPSTRPTRIPAIGPLKGMSETISAAEAAVIPWTSPSFSGSEEMTPAMTWVS